ncbi:type II toxin-antitoxin system VapC family toxin [Methylobacterium radiodurans]|nr:type II toxin-antitoxin system VapC family toxin [Methylobacterium radiodurans]
MLDTNICIHIRRARPLAVMRRFAKAIPGTVVTSVITYGELADGVARSQDPDEAGRRLAALARLIPVLPIEERVGALYGRLRADLAVAGRLIGGNDLWIGTHACVADLTLVTNNVGEFERVDGLRIEDWTIDAA